MSPFSAPEPLRFGEPETIQNLLSVLVPFYNEEEFVTASIERVLAAPLPEGLDREIVAVDDGSTDSSSRQVEELCARSGGTVRLFRHERNRGKGAALRTALRHARGEYCVIQDADLEYDPRELERLLRPLLEGRADAVYGSRFLVAGERRVLYFWHALANYLLTTLCNMAADLNLTDMETCYKAFRTSLLRSIPLRSERFGFEPEITIKLAQRQASIYELPVNYHGRTYEEGKKIRFRDAVDALRVILRFWLARDIYSSPGSRILDALSATPRFNRWMADTIRPYVGAEVLEIGAGIGNLTRLLLAGRKRYAATDVDAEHLARLRTRFYARPRLEILRCDLRSSRDFAGFSGSMDTVVCLNVIEHVSDDAAALANIRGALRPGGRAIILVPQGPSLFGRLDVVLGHFRRYTEAELTARMRAAGFRVERVLHFNRVTRPGWYWNGKVMRRDSLSRGQLWLFDRMVWLWRHIDAWLPWPPVSLIAIGVKPEA